MYKQSISVFFSVSVALAAISGQVLADSAAMPTAQEAQNCREEKIRTGHEAAAVVYQDLSAQRTKFCFPVLQGAAVEGNKVPVQDLGLAIRPKLVAAGLSKREQKAFMRDFLDHYGDLVHAMAGCALDLKPHGKDGALGCEGQASREIRRQYVEIKAFELEWPKYAGKLPKIHEMLDQDPGLKQLGLASGQISCPHDVCQLSLNPSVVEALQFRGQAEAITTLLSKKPDGEKVSEDGAAVKNLPELPPNPYVPEIPANPYGAVPELPPNPYEDGKAPAQ